MKTNNKLAKTENRDEDFFLERRTFKTLRTGLFIIAIFIGIVYLSYKIIIGLL